MVLPHPLGPMMATISPRSTFKSTLCRAFTLTLPVSYILTTSEASIIGPELESLSEFCIGDRAIFSPPIQPASVNLPLGELYHAHELCMLITVSSQQFPLQK